MVPTMFDYIKEAYQSTKDFFTPHDEEEFKRTVRQWSAHLTFLTSAVGGAGAGLALKEAIQSKGSENIVIGQIDSAFNTMGLSDMAVEGACIGAGVGAGLGAGKGLHDLIRPEDKVEINLPHTEREVSAEEAERILRREQQKTRIAMEQIAEALGVENVDDLSDGYAPLQSLESAIMDELKDVKEHPELLDIRTQFLDQSIARVIIATLQGVENAHPSVVKTITKGDNRDEVVEAAEETIAALQEDEEDEASDAAENGEADEPAEAAQA